MRRLTDAFISATIRLGVGPSQRCLLTVVGRRTRMSRTTPVSLVIVGSTRYLVAPYGEVEWVRNARAAPWLTLARKARTEHFRLAEISAAEAGPVLARYLKLEPITRPYFDVAPDAPPEAFVAEASTHPVFRLMPVSPGDAKQ